MAQDVVSAECDRQQANGKWITWGPVHEKAYKCQLLKQWDEANPTDFESMERRFRRANNDEFIIFTQKRCEMDRRHRAKKRSDFIKIIGRVDKQSYDNYVVKMKKKEQRSLGGKSSSKRIYCCGC